MADCDMTRSICRAGMLERRMPDAETVIYEPPKVGLPYLVVTLEPDGLSVLRANSRTEARTLVAGERQARRKGERKGKQD
jgi:hypothetical protein